jgi:hypothetical protein
MSISRTISAWCFAAVMVAAGASPVLADVTFPPLPTEPTPHEVAKILGLEWTAARFEFAEPEYVWFRVTTEQDGKRLEQVFALKDKTKTAVARVFLKQGSHGPATSDRVILDLQSVSGVTFTRTLRDGVGTDISITSASRGPNKLEWSATYSRWKADAAGRFSESDKGTVKIVVEHGPEIPPGAKTDGTGG